jgi:hypothetical protein
MDPENNIKEGFFKKLNNIIRNVKIKSPEKINLSLLIIIFLLVITVSFMVKPTITGLGVANLFEEKNANFSDFIKEQDITKSDLSLSESNLEACKKLNQEYSREIEIQNKDVFACTQEKSKIQSEMNILKSEVEFEKSKLESEYQQKNNEVDIQIKQFEEKYNQLESLYSSFVTNIANNICCKAKVDNKNIDSYLISNSMIVCTTGSENKISC